MNKLTDREDFDQIVWLCRKLSVFAVRLCRKCFFSKCLAHHIVFSKVSKYTVCVNALQTTFRNVFLFPQKIGFSISCKLSPRRQFG